MKKLVIDEKRSDVPCAYILKCKSIPMYVGKAKDVDKRIRTHFSSLCQGKMTPEFYRDIDEVEAIYCGSMAEASLVEIYLISTLHPQMNTIFLDQEVSVKVDLSMLERETFQKDTVDRWRTKTEIAQLSKPVAMFCDNVRRGRKHYGMSMIQVAKWAGITRQEVWKIENEKITDRITLNVIAGVARAFGIKDFRRILFERIDFNE